MTFGATVSASLPSTGTPSGSVTFSLGTTTLGTATLDGSGQASISTTSLLGGVHSIGASYTPANGAGYKLSSATLLQPVTPASTTTAVSLPSTPSVFGQPMTLNAQVTSTPGSPIPPTGAVTFFDGGTQLGDPQPVSNGAVSLALPDGLSVGSHAITAQYNGDDNYAASAASPPQSQQVNQAGTTATVSLASIAVNPSVFGQQLVFTAQVGATAPGAGTPTGTVTFFDGSTQIGQPQDLSAGATSITVPNGLPVGSRSITVRYYGNTNFSGNTSPTLPQTVDPAATTTSVSAAPASTLFGQSVTFTAVVSAVSPGAGTPSGSVNFYDSTTLLGTGTLNAVSGAQQATFSTSALSVLSVHTINAIYQGGSNFTGSTSTPYSLVVGQDSTTTTFSAPLPAAPVVGQAIQLQATVSAAAPGTGTPGGTVDFKAGGVTIASGTLSGGTVTATASTLGAANYTITAIYNGDGNFTTSSSATRTLTVNQATTSTALSISPSGGSATYGGQVIFSAQVSVNSPGSATSSAPGGTVEFRNGSTVLGTGTLVIASSTSVANFSSTTLAAGSYASITAVYLGDGNFLTSTSTPAQGLTITQDSSTVALQLTQNPTAFGYQATFTATVHAGSAFDATMPGGTVTFKDGSTALSAPLPLTNGSVNFGTNVLVAGGHSITVVYSGDHNFLANTSGATSQTVYQAGTTIGLNSAPRPASYLQPVTFIATVAVGTPGAGTPTGTVTFEEGSTPIAPAVSLGSNGAASVQVSSLALGTHTIVAVYSGDGSFTSSSSSGLAQLVQQSPTTVTIVTSSANPSVYGQGVTLVVKVSSPFGTPALGTVTLYDGTIALASFGLGSNGSGTSPSISNLTVGSHGIIAVYGSDHNYTGSSSASYSQIVHKALSTTALLSSTNPALVGQKLVLNASVAPVAPGVSVPSGTVTFLDGGTLLGTATLSNGRVSLSVSGLGRGSHGLTAVYGGDGRFLDSTSPVLSQTLYGLVATGVTLSGTVGVPLSSVVVATFSDDDPDPAVHRYTVTIDCGDGTSTSGYIGSLGNGFAVRGTHTYRAAGSYTVKVTIQAGDGRMAIAVGSAGVS